MRIGRVRIRVLSFSFLQEKDFLLTLVDSLPAPVSGEPAMSSSINQNTAPLTDFSYASDLLLNDQMWGDLGLGIDDWALSGSIPWMA